MNPPEIPPTRDYVTVEVKLRSGVTMCAHFCRRWGWRDNKFNELLDVVEWRKYKHDVAPFKERGQ